MLCEHPIMIMNLYNKSLTLLANSKLYLCRYNLFMSKNCL